MLPVRALPQRRARTGDCAQISPTGGQALSADAVWHPGAGGLVVVCGVGPAGRRRREGQEGNLCVRVTPPQTHGAGQLEALPQAKEHQRLPTRRWERQEGRPCPRCPPALSSGIFFICSVHCRKQGLAHSRCSGNAGDFTLCCQEPCRHGPRGHD